MTVMQCLPGKLRGSCCSSGSPFEKWSLFQSRCGVVLRLSHTQVLQGRMAGVPSSTEVVCSTAKSLWKAGQ